MFLGSLNIISINDSFESRTNPVPISVFSESRLELGKQAIHTVEAMLRGQIHPNEKIMLNGDLIIRDSCCIIR
jgi:DNA-binding LacI/PurR family transcriptional regulator